MKEISMVCALALIWLLAFKLTGDRRLFFPYSMLFAAAAIAAREHWFARGIAAPLLFFAIRIYQDASQSVLLVEAMFMVASLTPALMAREEGVQSLVELAGVLSLCSAIALIGLVF